ncbi:MAG: aminoglycoside phosphotransferase family protein [Bacilli bacterium]|nr:aminoglycoside phosphotransferase family protein [Bacilli bacterium]MDD4734255.1 aminoglycoside phosphotransferase family protein [Bacilli bacterium]
MNHLNNNQYEELVQSIAEINNLGVVKTLQRINVGFNNIIYRLNDEYFIKICTKLDKELGVKNEITFYQRNDFEFHPKLIVSDSTKKDIPYIYLVEESINGINLYDIWSELSVTQKKDVLCQLLNIIKTFHKKGCDKSESLTKIMESYDTSFKKAKVLLAISDAQQEYLQELKSLLPYYFSDALFSYIHGDIHFNNLMMSNDGKLKIIDFENYCGFPKDKEFDSISRMVRRPQDYKQSGNSKLLIPEECTEIIPYFKENYKEVCDAPLFEERLLIYDCLNSLKWISQYPKHQIYHDILFNKSKRLMK